MTDDAQGPGFRWVGSDFHPMSLSSHADMLDGRLEVTRHRRPADPATPFEGTFKGRLVGFYPTMEAARRALETWDTGLEVTRPPRR